MFRAAMAVLLCVPLAAYAVPLPRDVIPEKPSLEGTEWSGELEGVAFRYRFDKNGVLRYFSNSDMTSKGKWKQTSESVEFDINDYSFHKAKVQGNVLEGTSSNRDGRKWTFRLNRVKQ
jgi:hypothetical protein